MASQAPLAPSLLRDGTLPVPLRTRRQSWLPLVALLVVVAAMALAHGGRMVQNLHRHHWEDWRFLRHGKTNIATLTDCFTRPSAWPGLYRPLSTNAYYLVGHRLFGAHIEPYHLVNAALFAANALLLFVIGTQFLPGWWPLLPPLLFASRLAHAQVLCFTSEFQVLSSVFLTLIATCLFLEGRASERRGLELASLIPFALALLCKETAVVWPAILAVHGRLFDRRGSWGRYLPPVAVAAAWVGMFAFVRHAVGGGEPTGFLYDLSLDVIARAAAHVLTFSNPLAFTGKLDVTMPPLVESLARATSTQAAFALLVAAEGVLLLWRPASRALRGAAFGFAWFLLGVAPFLFFEDRLFMRYGYFGHAGLALAAAALLFAAARCALERRGSDVLPCARAAPQAARRG